MIFAALEKVHTFSTREWSLALYVQGSAKGSSKAIVTSILECGFRNVKAFKIRVRSGYGPARTG
jgi:hypothetical protein